jgi:hypothetical protein
VLHDHQANPHVHLSARAESKHGQRLNPRKADLHRWRETFAEKLRDYGIDAEATRQATRGRSWNPDALWRIKAGEDGRLRRSRSGTQSSPQAHAIRTDALEAWVQIGRALVASGDPADQSLAGSIEAFIKELPGMVRAPGTRSTAVPARAPAMAPTQKPLDVELRR